MNPEEMTLTETLQYLREEVWIKRFRKEEYDDVADAIEKVAENHSDTKFMEEATEEFLKTKAPNNHAEVYIEAMRGDFIAKMRGRHLEKGVN